MDEEEGHVKVPSRQAKANDTDPDFVHAGREGRGLERALWDPIVLVTTGAGSMFMPARARLVSTGASDARTDLLGLGCSALRTVRVRAHRRDGAARG